MLKGAGKAYDLRRSCQDFSNAAIEECWNVTANLKNFIYRILRNDAAPMP
jgi:hypothetical protein